MFESDENFDVRVPEDEEAVRELVSEEKVEELTDQQKNLTIAQGHLIGGI